MKQKIVKNKRLALLIVAVVVAGALLWYWHTRDNSTSTSGGYSSPQTSNGINYGPPTATEKQDSQDAKSRDLENSNSTPPVVDSSGKKQVTVQIISANRTSIKANIVGVFEDGGTCTATLSKGGQTKTFTSSGIASSNYTQCEPIALTGITESGWSAVVSYSSSTSAGQSPSITIN